MKNFFIFVAGRDNGKVVDEQGVYGVSDRFKNAINKVRVGDSVLLYITGESVFDGIYEVASEPYRNSKRIFKATQKIFPIRVKLKKIQTFEEPVSIRPLIKRLKFIKNKKWCTGSFRGKPIIEISRSDFEIIRPKH